MSFEDFLRDASFVLGTSQTEIENEFYVVDLPFLIQKKNELQNAERLAQLQLMIASNNRVMDEKDYKQFMNAITPQQIKADMNKFDREKFEQLRRMQG